MAKTSSSKSATERNFAQAFTKSRGKVDPELQLGFRSATPRAVRKKKTMSRLDPSTSLRTGAGGPKEKTKTL